jgi:hypothetical protein
MNEMEAHDLARSLPVGPNNDRVHIRSWPLDRRGRRCAEWCAHHHMIRAFYTVTSYRDDLSELEQALQNVPGVYATTQVLKAKVVNPDWPYQWRITDSGLRNQVWALIKEVQA